MSGFTQDGSLHGKPLLEYLGYNSIYDVPRSQNTQYTPQKNQKSNTDGVVRYPNEEPKDVSTSKANPQSKGMSLNSSKGATQPPSGVGGVKKGSMTKNGNGPPPLSYTEPVDDVNMNEIIDENVEVNVTLPDGRMVHHSVEPNIPMMDLLVNLAASNRLNPAAHTLVVLSEDRRKPVEYKANQTVGSLAGKDERTIKVQIVKKKSEAEKKADSAKNAKPFEASAPFQMTYRFTVNLPRNQKKVLRISPKLTLEEVYLQVCQEKNFNPNNYSLQLPGSPQTPVNLQQTVADLKTNEINLVNLALVESAKSVPDLPRSQSMRNESTEPYMPMAGEKKSKRGFLSFLGKKDKKFKVQEMALNIEPGPAGRGTSQEEPVQMRRREEDRVRPQTMFVSSPSDIEPMKTKDTNTYRNSVNLSQPVKENVPPQKTVPPAIKKKRPAPPPPQKQEPPPKTIQVEINIEPKSNEEERVENISRIEDITDSTRTANKLHKLHSRNSSDSSGYHELTLSGADSPEHGKIDEQFTGFKTSGDTASLDSGDHFNGDSGIRDMSPVRKRMELRESTPREVKSVIEAKPQEEVKKSTEPVAPSRKKKRAPPPPPGTVSGSGPVSTSTPTSAPPPPQELQPQTEPVEATVPQSKGAEAEAMHAMEEVTMEFDMALAEDEMLMVEDESLRSEDIDLDKSKPLPRPCAFVAPPPPSEPPPPDIQPVDYNTVMGSTERIDIGVGDATTSEPSSTKSSPKSIRSRPDSRASDSSVNTLEDISMAFNLAIAFGEETMEQDNNAIASTEGTLEQDINAIAFTEGTLEQDINAIALAEGMENDKNDIKSNEDAILKAEMPEFKDKIEQLAAENDNENPAEALKTSSRSGLSEDSARSLGKDTSSDVSSIMEDLGTKPEPDSFEIDKSELESLNLTPNEKGASEITYEFKIDAVPLEFQSEQEDQKETKTGVEEFPEKPERVLSLPLSSEYGLRKIPDLDSPKEHRGFSLPAKETLSDENQFESSQQIKVQEPVVEAEPEKPEEPKPKEEFVLTMDDLNNIDFSGPKPKKRWADLNRDSAVFNMDEVKYVIGDHQCIVNEHHPTQQEEHEVGIDEDPLVTKDEQFVIYSPKRLDKEEAFTFETTPRSYSSDDDFYSHDDYDLDNNKVKDRCSELSFTPNSEGEVEHVMEEKSISMLALPAVRTVAKADDNYVDDDSELDSARDTYKSSAEITLSGKASSGKTKSPPSPELAEASGESVDAQSLLQAQYQQLQQQFAMWQQQLLQNQTQLAKQTADGQSQGGLQEQSQILQLQMQMQLQQQMMLQLQQSMQTLALQNVAVPRPAKVVRQPQVEEPSTPPTPPLPTTQPPPMAPPLPPPTAPAVPPPTQVKMTAKVPDAKYSKPSRPANKGRFQPELDPREELMLAIRGFGGRAALRKVPVKATHWHK